MSSKKLATSYQLPTTSSPGVYFFRGPKNKVLYIGKAANLKHRLASYKKASDPRIIKMLETAVDLDWQETGSEIEALILESQLIKKHRPPFNIMLRDDKQYFFVGITKETFPRIFLTHQTLTRGALAAARAPLVRYVGPFTEGSSLKSTLKLLRRIFPYCTCQQKHHRYCLNYHLGNCLGFCCLKNNPDQSVRAVEKQHYKKNIQAIKDILNGKRGSVLKNLKKEMDKSAKKQDFEKAIELRRKLDHLQRVFENAKVIKEMTSRSKVLEEMQKVLGLSNVPQRIEGYDISNIQGQFATGAMVVFNNGYPNKNEYRKFKIRQNFASQNLGGQVRSSVGDVQMLKEILTRRFNHPEWPFPDLIVIDGGKAQLNIALKTMGIFASDAKMPMVTVIALTKNEKHYGHHIFSSKEKTALPLSDLPLPIKNLIIQIDSEAHRFAISYYRKLHRKTM